MKCVCGYEGDFYEIDELLQGDIMYSCPRCGTLKMDRIPDEDRPKGYFDILSPEDAARAMLDGDTLQDENGNFANWNGKVMGFVWDNGGYHLEQFDGLKRIPLMKIQ
ncbi:hypothetical protein FACS1894137_11230 [Spirochaetia bacterium]|nr:hypothetical protein FACS1894137_11230 [Spirochaetia bacterium]